MDARAESEPMGVLAQILAEALAKDSKKKNAVYNLGQSLTQRTNLAQTRARRNLLCPCLPDDEEEQQVSFAEPAAPAAPAMQRAAP